MHHLTAGIVMLIFAVNGFVGNTFILLICIKQKLPERRNYYLILTLSVADGIANFIDIAQTGVSVVRQRLTFDGLWNRAFGWLYVHCFQIHVTLITFMITVQCLHIFKKQWRDKLFQKKPIVVAITVLCLFPLWQTVFLIPAYPFDRMARMSFLVDRWTWYFNTSYPAANPLTTASDTFIFFCFSLSLLCSLTILYKIWKAGHMVSESTDLPVVSIQQFQIKRFSFQHIVVVCIFLFQSLLFLILPQTAFENRDVLFVLTLTNPILFGFNFFIYVFVNKTFRKEFVSLFSCKCQIHRYQ